MEQVEVKIINAFTDGSTGGNPAGVVFNADKLSSEQKLLIARKVGLSETAFVSQSDIADFRLDFFTPARQIAHCGHATIAVFSWLMKNGMIKSARSSKETIDGRREILLQGDQAYMEQKAPVYKDISPQHDAILQSLGLSGNDILPGAPISLVNTGNSFAIIPVANEEVLKNLKTDFDLITRISKAFDLVGYYVFCPGTAGSRADANARMFAPAYGIEEESGTGMAAGPLACYLYDVIGIKKEQYIIQQGRFMKSPSPSLINVNLSLDNGRIVGLMAGGNGIVMNSLWVPLQ